MAGHGSTSSTSNCCATSICASLAITTPSRSGSSGDSALSGSCPGRRSCSRRLEPRSRHVSRAGDSAYVRILPRMAINGAYCSYDDLEQPFRLSDSFPSPRARSTTSFPRCRRLPSSSQAGSRGTAASRGSRLVMEPRADTTRCSALHCCSAHIGNSLCFGFHLLFAAYACACTKHRSRCTPATEPRRLRAFDGSLSGPQRTGARPLPLAARTGRGQPSSLARLFLSFCAAMRGRTPQPWRWLPVPSGF